ncbi:hypothetical protein [Paracidovorax citrulli]|uniref:hypothetical protein n=1 Tax=Paracidovorax citrulli TaxID=80869 RepID=UPI003FA777AA
MSNFLGWTKQNLALPLALAAVTACGSAIYQSQEIDARQYQLAAAMYEDGTNRFRSLLVEETAQGEITRWTFTALIRDFWSDGVGLTMPLHSDSLSLQDARAQLMVRVYGSGAAPSGGRR